MVVAFRTKFTKDLKLNVQVKLVKLAFHYLNRTYFYINYFENYFLLNKTYTSVDWTSEEVAIS